VGRFGETERQRDRETERQRDRETERQRDRETVRQQSDIDRDRGKKCEGREINIKATIVIFYISSVLLSAVGLEPSILSRVFYHGATRNIPMKDR
jgi:hypothetical protein